MVAFFFFENEKNSFLGNFFFFSILLTCHNFFLKKSRKKLYEKNRKETGEGFWEIARWSLPQRVGIIHHFGLTNLETVRDLGKLRLFAVHSFLY